MISVASYFKLVSEMPINPEMKKYRELHDQMKKQQMKINNEDLLKVVEDVENKLKEVRDAISSCTNEDAKNEVVGLFGKLLDDTLIRLQCLIDENQ